MNINDRYPVRLVPNAGWDPRVLVVRCGTMVDSFIVVGASYIFLIDTLINPQTANSLLDLAGEYLIDGKQLLVINTHADFDHCWGNQVFVGPKATYPAPIIASRLCAERLMAEEARITLEDMQAQEPDLYADVELAAPTIRFDDHLVIDAGDLTLRLFATPGHQPDHTSILIPEISLLLAGDSAESPFPFAQSAASLPQLRISLAYMAALNPAYALYCHAPITIGPELLRQNAAYFDALEQRCREALDAGIPTQPTADADVVALINYPLNVAVPPADGKDYAPFYVDGHAAQIRIMLEYLGAQQEESKETKL